MKAKFVDLMRGVVEPPVDEVAADRNVSMPRPHDSSTRSWNEIADDWVAHAPVYVRSSLCWHGGELSICGSPRPSVDPHRPIVFVIGPLSGAWPGIEEARCTSASA